MLRKMLIGLCLVCMVSGAVNTAFADSPLPAQEIDFSVADPKASANLSLPLYEGAGYRADYKTWSLLEDGGFMEFKLRLDGQQPVNWGMSVAASLVDGKANCPFSITVNGRSFVKSYHDTNSGFHWDSWNIPAELLQGGDNKIVVSLDGNATTQLFINTVRVQHSYVPDQTVDFSTPNPSATANLSLPLYEGAGYRADFKTWSLLEDGGFMKFDLKSGAAVDTKLTLKAAASIVDGKANCPISITVNDQSLVKGFKDTNTGFHDVSWTISSKMLKSGSNSIVVTLDNDATTQYFIQATSVAQTVK